MQWVNFSVDQWKMNNNKKKKLMNLADTWQISRISKPNYARCFLLQTLQLIWSSPKFTCKASKWPVDDDLCSFGVYSIRIYAKTWAISIMYHY